jgi:hypothetical protein
LRATSLISAEASAMPTTHATSTAGGVTFQSLHECRDRQGGWVLHGQVSVVGVAVELEAFSSSDGGPAPLGGAAIAGVAEVELTDRPVRDDVLE